MRRVTQAGASAIGRLSSCSDDGALHHTSNLLLQEPAATSRGLLPLESSITLRSRWTLTNSTDCSVF